MCQRDEICLAPAKDLLKTSGMTEIEPPKISKSAFFLGDLLLLGVGGFLIYQAPRAMDPWNVLLLVICVLSGAWLAAYPFMAEYKASVKLAEAEGLGEAVERLKGMETIGNQIIALSSQWQTVQDHANNAVEAVQGISERMSMEAKAFSELTTRMNQQEKAHLRLEVEKLRRNEGEWIQVLMGFSDHIFALFQAAFRSGEQRVIEQVGRLQGSCHEIARKVGFVAFGAVPDESFDPAKHQTETGTTEAGAKILAMLAPGYMYQGQLVRRVLVTLAADEPHKEAESLPEGAPQSHLPL
jgi:molecular chaperone GrpE (heat shock protein)